MAAKPLHGLVGVQWVPAWAIRPGAYEALKDLSSEMPLFLLLYSRNADHWKPCYASRDDLGKTIGVSRATVSRHLKALREAYLLFEVDRGIEPKSQRHRPPARWALDPFAAELWRAEVEESLGRVAEDDGHDGRWLHRAVTSLDAFDRRSRLLAAKISEDMLVKPTRKRRSSKKKRKKKRAATQNESRTQNEPRGDVITTGEVVGERPGRGPVGRENGAKKTGAAARTKDSTDSTTRARAER